MMRWGVPTLQLRVILAFCGADRTEAESDADDDGDDNDDDDLDHDDNNNWF